MNDAPIPDLSIAILAGGRSLRMGINKALLDAGGAPIILRAAECARAVADEVFLSANDLQSYSFLHLPIVPDVYRHCGPLAGLHAAFQAGRRPLLLLLACDLPNVSEILLRRLAAAAEGFDAVIPRTSDGRVHPLCAVYRRSCLPVIERNLRQGNYRMLGLFENSLLRTSQPYASEMGFQDAVFDNLNTPEDLTRWQQTQSDKRQ